MEDEYKPCPWCGEPLSISKNNKIIYECSNLECSYIEYMYLNSPKVKAKGGKKLMNTIEKWNKIVDFYQENLKKLEKNIQKDWETICSEILGYKVIAGNIEAQKYIPLAVGKPIKLDILLRKENKEVCVIELKQHQTLNKDWEDQLFTYLRQVKIKIGLLVCDKIYIYSYEFSKDDSNQSYITIDFKKDNPDGIKFIDMFTLDNFNEESISTFVKEYRGKKQNVKDIQGQIDNPLIYNLLEKHFVPTYPIDDFKTAIQNLEISIKKKAPISLAPKAVPIGKAALSLDKGEIFKICHEHGINLPSKFTKAAKNTGAPTYWANPNKIFLYQDWWLVLDNLPERKLHVFMIPANSIQAEKFNFKNADLIDLQIHYNDHHYPNFTDRASKIDFKQWLVQTIPY